MDRRPLRLIAVALASVVLSLGLAWASIAQEPAPSRLGAGSLQATLAPGLVLPVFPPAAGLGQVRATLTATPQPAASPTPLPGPTQATPTLAAAAEALPLTGSRDGLGALVGLAPMAALLLLALPALAGRTARGK